MKLMFHFATLYIDAMVFESYLKSLGSIFVGKVFRMASRRGDTQLYPYHRKKRFLKTKHALSIDIDTIIIV
jgi:hypothetical protein